MDVIKKLISQRFSYLEVIYWLFFLFSITYKCIYFQFTTKLNKVPYISSVNITMLLSTIAVLLIISSFISIIFNRGRLIAIFIFNLLLTVVLVADTNFFRYYYNLITIPVFFQFNVKLVSSINQSIISLFKIKDIIYILDIPFMFMSLYLLQKKISHLHFTKRIIRSAFLFAVGLVIILSVYSNSNIHAFAYSNSYSAKSLGVFYSHYQNTKLYIQENLMSDENLSSDEKENIESLFASKNKSYSANNLRGAAKGKNLIIVQMEAMQHFVINKQINGKEITPNLNKLIKESLYFDNIYYQVAGGNTSDAEFLCNTSMYPSKEGSVYYNFPENTYNSLPSILKDKGYDTYSLHAFDAEFWNRSQMHSTLKFDKFISSKDYILDDFAGWSCDALSDESFFRQSIEKIDTAKPFYSFLVTLSSHHPFSYFENFDFDVGELQGTYMGNYLKAANYADKCIGNFIDDLKRRNLYNNSLLVFYGDHSAVPKIQSNELMQFLGKNYSDLEWIKLQKVPLIMHYPGQTVPDVINTTGGQIDILPTIANLMDFTAPYSFGKDLLNTNTGYAILRNGSVITENYVYFNDSREIYDLSSEVSLDLSLYEDELSSYLNELNISDTVLLKDVFKNHFNKR